MNKDRYDLIESLEWDKINKNIKRDMIIEYILNPYKSFASIKIAVKCLYLNIDTDIFKLICVDNIFDVEKMKEFLLGIKSGHTYDDIKLYAATNYNCFQIKELRISVDSIGRKNTKELFSEYELSFSQIHLYRTMVERNIRSVKFIKKYMIHRYFNEQQILKYIEIYYRRFPMSVTDILIHNDFDSDQLEEIIQGINNDLTFEQIKSYANEDFDHLQMREIRFGYCDVLTDDVDEDKVKLYVDPECCPERMKFIRERLFYDIEYLEIFADRRFTKEQVEVLDRFIEKGVDKDIILISAEHNLSPSEIAEKILKWIGGEKVRFKNILSRKDIFTKAIDSNLHMDKIKFMASKDYDDCQLYQLWDGFSRGLSIEEVSKYSDIKNNFIDMECKKNQILKERKRNKNDKLEESK